MRCWRAEPTSPSAQQLWAPLGKWRDILQEKNKNRFVILQFYNKVHIMIDICEMATLWFYRDPGNFKHSDPALTAPSAFYLLSTGNASSLLCLKNCPLKSYCLVYLYQKWADVAQPNMYHRWSTNQRRCWWQHPRFHVSPAALASAETPGRRRWSAWDVPPCQQHSPTIRTCVQRWGR